MLGKKTQTKRNTKAGTAAKARSTRNARSTVKATGAETLSEPDRLTRRNLEIREYAKAMGLFSYLMFNFFLSKFFFFFYLIL